MDLENGGAKSQYLAYVVKRHAYGRWAVALVYSVDLFWRKFSWMAIECSKVSNGDEQ